MVLFHFVIDSQIWLITKRQQTFAFIFSKFSSQKKICFNWEINIRNKTFTAGLLAPHYRTLHTTMTMTATTLVVQHHMKLRERTTTATNRHTTQQQQNFVCFVVIPDFLFVCISKKKKQQHFIIFIHFVVCLFSFHPIPSSPFIHTRRRIYRYIFSSSFWTNEFFFLLFFVMRPKTRRVFSCRGVCW